MRERLTAFMMLSNTKTYSITFILQVVLKKARYQIDFCLFLLVLLL